MQKKSSIYLKCKETVVFLVAQWIRIHLPRQETQVWSLIREDPTCRGASKPANHNYGVCSLEPGRHSFCAPVLQSPWSTREASRMRSPCSAEQSRPGSLLTAARGRLSALSAEWMDFTETHLGGPQRAFTEIKCPKAMLTVSLGIMCQYLNFSKNSSTVSRAAYECGLKEVIFYRYA